MITTVGMAYERKNFFGERELVYEKRTYGIERKHILKGLSYIIDHAEDYPCLHMDVNGTYEEGGTHEEFHQEYHQRGTDMLTWTHWKAANSRDTREVPKGEALRISREWEK